METNIAAPVDDGQGQVSTEGAPGVDTNGGQGAGTGEETGQFAGFNTREELVADYQNKVGELTNLKTQVTNLESLKGRHGNEIGSLRNQIATLTGQIEGMKTAAPSEPVQKGVSLDDIAKQLDAGDIDEVQAIRMGFEAGGQQIRTELGREFQQMLQMEIGNLRHQTEQERYAEKFIADNPGYSEAFESGKLDPWLTINADGTVTGGEFAWAQYQLQAKEAEIEALKKGAADTAQAAEQAGIEKGTKIEQGKTAAGRVLTGKGGQFSQVKNNYNLNDKAQRAKAGVELLNRMRSG